MVEAFLASLFPLVAHGRPRLVLPVAQKSGLVIGCLPGWDNQRNVVVGCALDVLTFLTDET